MKLFIKRTLYFLLVGILVNILIDFALPQRKYWGNREYERKIRHFKAKGFNTVFFGSSRILTGVNPLLFDSLCNIKTNIGLRSYNLATAGTWATETFYLYENFLEDRQLSKNVGVVFMEFQNIMAIRPDKITSDKAIYYQNLNNLSFISNYALEEMKLDPMKIPPSLYTQAVYIVAALERLFNLGRFSIARNNDDLVDSAGVDQRGYLDLTTRAKGERQFDRTKIEDYKTSIKNNHLNTEKKRLNSAFFEKVNELIRRSASKGITLVFVLPPVKLTPGMMAVFQNIPDRNKIDLCNPEKYPELFDATNWIDETHLNKNGSAFLNVYLSKGYINEAKPEPTNQQKVTSLTIPSKY